MLSLAVVLVVVVVFSFLLCATIAWCVWSILFIYSIRDHAEQKLYQALGPYAAMKRSGRKPNLALIVAGCVAQQEGQALLRRIPELDVVLGPQYIPHLPAVLQQVAHGSQVVVTAPTVLQQPDAPPQRHNHQNHNHTGPAESAVVPDDFFTPPIRGHDVVRCTVGNNKTVPNWRRDRNDSETNLHCLRGCTHAYWNVCGMIVTESVVQCHLWMQRTLYLLCGTGHTRDGTKSSHGRYFE